MTANVKRPDLPRVEVDQTDNPKPHDYRKDNPTPYRPQDKCVVFCLSCGLVRSANGSTDRKPCRGPVGISLRAKKEHG